MPVTIAELRARKRCTSLRAASLVIQRLSPFAIAVAPSRLAAILQRTKGRLRMSRERKPALSSRAPASHRPVSTSMPAWLQCIESAARDPRIRVTHGGDDARNARRDERLGAGRRAALMAARLEADVRRRSGGGTPAARKAWISACGSPARMCQPSPMTCPSRTISHSRRVDWVRTH